MNATSWPVGRGDGSEGAKFWPQVLTELKNRGVQDARHHGLRRPEGPPRTPSTPSGSSPRSKRIPHLIRNTFRYASRKYWDQVAHDLRPVYTAATEAEAKARFEEFAEKGPAYPAITKLWQNAWSEFVPFLDYDVEIRKIISSTNAIESLNARYRRGCGPRALPQ